MIKLREIIVMKPHDAPLPPKKRVAAYARVSRETERTDNSLSAQVSYYSELIQQNPNWDYAGVYIDRFITGTIAQKRGAFNNLIADCDAGKIDIVLVKSISRFARNTLDLLNSVRHLKDIGVDVYFEKEDIHSMSSDGEFMLTVLASFAQDEIRSMSDNIRWSIQKRFEQGKPHTRYKVFGYEWDGWNLVVNAEEAETIRKIFHDFLSGDSVAEIERALNHRLSYEMIRNIILNEIYTGTLILQKTYVADPISKKTKINNGERTKYIIDDNHEAIIDRETFDKAQFEMRRRSELGAISNKFINTSYLTGKIRCGICGNVYTRQSAIARAPHYNWMCKTKTHESTAKCNSKNVPERYIREKFSEVSGRRFSEAAFTELIDYVMVIGKNILEYHFRDGRTARAEWEMTGNKERWSEEERAKKSEYAKAHPFSSGAITYFTGKVRCGICGNNYKRNHIKTNDTQSWGCQTGKKKCGIRWIREEELKRVSAKAMGSAEFDERQFADTVDHITVYSNEDLTVYFKDGTEKAMTWNSKRIVNKRKGGE